ncbi:very short patch repair endonuclease [Vampirovibrio chlorellavorus]|uniref:very short patch repair endonuclease n=1 Tax=Vampirovibrio chlorellavorus TaxID=758823 RepID=UPI0026F08D6B|nr:very short patch repair endonuclease [Vampirovibrio chlorellavorus]
MKTIKSKGTKPELLLGKALWADGLRYRKHYKIKGRPDFVFVGTKVAVFCDGDFWHGNNWSLRGLASLEEELLSYSEFWVTKIKRNVARDLETNKILEQEGWLVLRFWESEIYTNIEIIVQKIKEAINSRKHTAD